MKKAFFGFAVLGVYGIYSVGIRHERPIIAKPKAIASVKPKASKAAVTPTLKPAHTLSDGTYTGRSENAYYGNVQVSVTISGGRITGVKFLSYPNSHSTSVYINQQAMPYLKQEAIQAQSSHVSIISGATFTSEAFIQSLQSALNKVK